jgi:hypothetical protein
MKKADARKFHVRKSLMATMLGAALILATSPARALELGVASVWIHNDAIGGGGLAHGASLMVDQEVWRYADVGARAGYMRSDCFKTFYVPLELTARLQLPLCNDRFVPFAGLIGEYRVFTSSKQDLDNAFGISPNVGFNWRWGKTKQWSIFVEVRYQFLQADIKTGGHARFDGPGGSGGLTYRF